KITRIILSAPTPHTQPPNSTLARRAQSHAPAKLVKTLAGVENARAECVLMRQLPRARVLNLHRCSESLRISPQPHIQPRKISPFIGVRLAKPAPITRPAHGGPVAKKGAQHG